LFLSNNFQRRDVYGHRRYQPTAAYGHFGRDPYTQDGIKFFEWENAKDLKKYAKMTSKQVSAELKSSSYLTKWVD